MKRLMVSVVVLLQLGVAAFPVMAAGGPANEAEAAARDAELSRQIVGTWLEGESPMEVSVFKPDGGFEGVVYWTPERETVIATMKGSWFVKQGVLYHVYRETEPKTEEAGEPIFIGKIIAVSRDALTLADQSDLQFTKVREKPTGH